MFYKAFKVFIKAIFFTLFRVKIVGKENTDIKGKFIVYSNHRSAIDPVFIHCMLKRKPRFMGKKEAFRNRFFAWVITGLGAFPVDRDHADMTAIKTAFKILNDGEVLGIFPEGKRSTDGNMGEFLSGAAMMAVRAKAPMLPVYISRKAKPFCRLRVIVGKPYDMRERLEQIAGETSYSDSVAVATKIMRDEVIALKEGFEKGCLR